jgi:hypothetical protein
MSNFGSVAFSIYLEFQAMGRVQKPSVSGHCICSSAPLYGNFFDKCVVFILGSHYPGVQATSTTDFHKRPPSVVVEAICRPCSNRLSFNDPAETAACSISATFLANPILRCQNNNA